MIERTSATARRGWRVIASAPSWSPLCKSLSFMAVSVFGCGGCNSFKNGWLDPTVLGKFDQSAITEIRTSLTLEDTPVGIPGATLPTQDDLKVHVKEFPISPGDELGVEINELRQRQVPYQARLVVSPRGELNLPIVGPIKAEGLTSTELQDKVISALQEKDILRTPDVTITPLLVHQNTYSLFGVGVSAADNSPLRAGTFPIPRPDLRLLEAINRVGGLNEFVTDIYVFRCDNPQDHAGESSPMPDAPGFENTRRDGSTGPATKQKYDVDSKHEDTSASARVLSNPGDIKITDEMLAAVDPHEGPGQQKQEETAEELLRPEPTQPFLYIDGRWERNPEFREPPVQADSTTVPTGTEAITPAISWARIAGESTYRVLHIPADPLRDGDPSVNIVVRAGDLIRIVSGEVGVYYVMGQTNRVGVFAFNTEKVTLKTAIATAGGLSALAWPDRCTIYRRIGQREQMIQVNLDRIFAGQDADFLIKRGDIINVGTHPFAPFLQIVRAATLPTVVNQMGYSFTYARNFADIDSFSVKTNPRNQPDRFPNLFP